MVPLSEQGCLLWLSRPIVPLYVGYMDSFFIDLHIQRRNIQTRCPKYHTIQDFSPDALTGWGFWVISPLGRDFVCRREGSEHL